MIQQPNLFPEIRDKFIGQSNQPRLEMSKKALLAWKQKIYRFQKRVREQPQPVQTSLFETAPTWNADSIDPFNLRLHNWMFFDAPDCGDRELYYFIIDTSVPLLLYIGETKQTAKQRWQNHDCRTYIGNYIAQNRQYGLEPTVCAAFSGSAPRDRAQRQKLETELILKWRSPFNKQCWQWWGQPFGK